MKRKLTVIVTSVITLSLMILISWSFVSFAGNPTRDTGLSFSGKTNKATYILGEPVGIQFEFVNDGDLPKIVPDKGVEVGSLKIFLADERDGIYKEYFASGWGRQKGQRSTLLPKQSHKYDVTILWNGTPNVSHLNETTAQQVLAGKVTTEYALPNPGVYFIKGVSYAGENFAPIESEPVKIIITQPEGIDLEVWKQIKGNREIAYLMQKDAFDTEDGAKKAQLSSQVEQIYTQFPNSIYSSYLKPNLEKYKAHQIVMKESMEKAMIKPKN